jgi:hypothetical protein
MLHRQLVSRNDAQAGPSERPEAQNPRRLGGHASQSRRTPVVQKCAKVEAKLPCGRRASPKVSDVSAASLPKDCPPGDAGAPSGVFFLYARPIHNPGDPLGDDDWVLPWQKPKGAGKGRTDVCQAWAYSLFDDLARMHEMRENEPWTRNKSIAQVELSEADGSILATGSRMGPGHHSWWPRVRSANGRAQVAGVVIEGACG